VFEYWPHVRPAYRSTANTTISYTQFSDCRHSLFVELPNKPTKKPLYRSNAFEWSRDPAFTRTPLIRCSSNSVCLTRTLTNRLNYIPNPILAKIFHYLPKSQQQRPTLSMIAFPISAIINPITSSLYWRLQLPAYLHYNARIAELYLSARSIVS